MVPGSGAGQRPSARHRRDCENDCVLVTVVEITIQEDVLARQMGFAASAVINGELSLNEKLLRSKRSGRRRV